MRGSLAPATLRIESAPTLVSPAPRLSADKSGDYGQKLIRRVALELAESAIFAADSRRVLRNFGFDPSPCGVYAIHKGKN